MTRQRTPRAPRSAASARPAGPAPTIRTGVSIVPEGIYRGGLGDGVRQRSSIGRYLFLDFLHRLGGELYGLGGRGIDLADQRPDLGAGHRIDVEIELLGLGQEFRVLHGRVEGVAQGLRPI